MPRKCSARQNNNGNCVPTVCEKSMQFYIEGERERTKGTEQERERVKGRAECVGVRELEIRSLPQKMGAAQPKTTNKATRHERSRTVSEPLLSLLLLLFSLSIEHTPQWTTTTTNKAADIKEPMEQSQQTA